MRDSLPKVELTGETEVDEFRLPDGDDPEEALMILDLVIAGDRTLGRALHRIASLLVHTLSGVDSASVTLYRQGQGRTAAFTDQTAALLDERQYQLDAGPCLHAARTQQRVQLDCAWPSTTGGTEAHCGAPDFSDFIDQARRIGVRSATALPLGEVTDLGQHSGLVARSGLVGVLNTYTRGATPLAGQDLRSAEAFASRARFALASAVTYAAAVEEATNVKRALESRALIEQAKGVLMASFGLDAAGAFAELRRRSSHSNRKLRDVAADILDATRKGSD